MEKQEDYWNCNLRVVIRTGSCWVVLMLALITSVVVTYCVLNEYAFKEENYVFHYPFNSIFDVTQVSSHTVECENCEVFGSHEDLDDSVNMEFAQTEFFFYDENNDLSVHHKNFNGKDYSCLKFEVRGGENYVLNLTATTDVANFMLHYEGRDDIHTHVVEDGKPLSVDISPEENDHLYVCVLKEDEKNPVSSFFSSEIITLDEGAKVHNCTPICRGYENYFIRPKHGMSMVYYSEYLPVYSRVIIGVFLWVGLFLVCIIFCFKLTVGCAAYPCLRRRRGGNGNAYLNLREFVADNEDQ